MTSVLVITTSFAPENAIGALRPAKFVKYMVRAGCQITVISPVLDDHRPRDDSLECDELSQITRVTVDQGLLFQKLFASRRLRLLSGQSATKLVSLKNQTLVERIRALIFQYLHFAYTLLRNWDWSRQVIQSLKEKDAEAGYASVLSSYPSLGAMWAASWVRRQGHAKSWVADFRDPVNYEKNSTALIQYIYTWIQHRIVNRSDQVTAVSHGVARKLDCDETNGKVTVLPNGFDPEDHVSLSSGGRYPTRNRKFRLAYVGSLYGGQRDISVVFSAVDSLVREGLADKNEIEFIYAGSDFEFLRSQASASGLQSILVNRGRISRMESLEVQDSSDIVIVATWNSEQDQGIMTGKVFECFLLRKPIIGVVGGDKPGSEFGAVVRSVGAGVVFEAADAYRPQFEKMVSFLAGKMRELRQTGVIRDEYNDAVREFEYPSLAQRLVEIMDSA
jgi:hypothetical protein